MFVGFGMGNEVKDISFLHCGDRARTSRHRTAKRHYDLTRQSTSDCLNFARGLGRVARIDHREPFCRHTPRGWFGANGRRVHDRPVVEDVTRFVITNIAARHRSYQCVEWHEREDTIGDDDERPCTREVWLERRQQVTIEPMRHHEGEVGATHIER